MMNPAPTTWTPPASDVAPIRVAFAMLDRRQQRLLEAVVFEGASCAELAGVIGVAASDVRHQVGAAMQSLYAQVAPSDRAPGGAVATMLALRALDALDADEAELVDVMLLHQPALQRSHAAYEELVGELCALVPQIAPAGRVLARLSDAIAAETGADDAAN
jgi:hypothetical protein